MSEKKKKWIKAKVSNAVEKEGSSNKDMRHKGHISPSKMMKKMYGSKE